MEQGSGGEGGKRAKGSVIGAVVVAGGRAVVNSLDKLRSAVTGLISYSLLSAVKHRVNF